MVLLRCEIALCTTFLYGGTLTNPWTQVPAITTSLQTVAYKPTVRFVFDTMGVTSADYAPMISAVEPVAFIMGEICDSQYVSTFTVAQYQSRVKEYVNAFAGIIDIFEIGNEVNGEWLMAGTDTPATVVDKIYYAFNYTRLAAANASIIEKPKTALTLYYNYNISFAGPTQRMKCSHGRTPKFPQT